MRKRRWDRGHYPENWEDISQSFRASRNYTCEHCGTERGTLRVSKAGNQYGSKAVAAHRYPNDTSNPDPELLCLCERCHFVYDVRFRWTLEEGEHQRVLHEILVERHWEQEEVRRMDEGLCVAQFVRACWGRSSPYHRIIDICRVGGLLQKVWHVYYLYGAGAGECLETALVVYEDEKGVLQIGDEQNGHVYTDEQGMALRMGFL